MSRCASLPQHFTSQREDFEGNREGILVWLTEMDLQLTNVEHFSESDIEDKMRQLNVSRPPPFGPDPAGLRLRLTAPPPPPPPPPQAFQQEITLNANKIDALIVFGENLIQKSAPLDAALIEDELEELHSYCQEVFGRVARFHHRLVSRRPVSAAAATSASAFAVQAGSPDHHLLGCSAGSGGGEGAVRPRHGPGRLARADQQDVLEAGEEEEEEGGAAPAGSSPPGAPPGALGPRDPRQRGLHPAGVGPHGGRGRIVLA